MNLELDHVFVFIEPDGPEPARLAALGFQENFRRSHPGQGTSNICYFFDNAYLELLFVVDAAEARAPAVAQTRLAERACWRDNGASPIGVALRGYGPEAPLPFDTWNYETPFRPRGRPVLPVATFSDDPAQPFVFGSPGNTRPDQWTDDRKSERQTALGVGEMLHVEIVLPEAVEPAAELCALAAQSFLAVSSGPAPGVTLTLSRNAEAPLRLCLPDCRLL